MKPIGIIGGSGMYEMLDHPRMFIHDNIYGRSSEIYEGQISGRTVYFLPRHGPNHTIIVPRMPNNRAMEEQADCAGFPALLKQRVEDCVCKHAPDSAVLAKQ